MGATASARDSTSARELGKNGKFLHSHCLRVHKSQIF